jgi:hypothetical protein
MNTWAKLKQSALNNRYASPENGYLGTFLTRELCDEIDRLDKKIGELEKQIKGGPMKTPEQILSDKGLAYTIHMDVIKKTMTIQTGKPPSQQTIVDLKYSVRYYYGNITLHFKYDMPQQIIPDRDDYTGKQPNCT